MCGIFGIVSLKEGLSPDPSHLKRMGDIIEHRGPDDFGAYSAPGVAMGMRRLSIIDLALGHQPIANEDETLWVVCNGEIYNFRNLRDLLIRRGHRFRTGSDSETILHLYEEFGLDFVEHMDGMFGFALWDTKRSRLVLGRDRLGVKPLYVYRDVEKLVFASEVKSILRVPGVQASIDPIGVQEYFSFGYTPTASSIFDGIEKLAPASLLVCEDGVATTKSYWALPDHIDHSLSESQWATRVREVIEDSVAAEMVSDVPLGAFLSGGIDSSAVVAMMARHSSQPVKTYAIGFDTGRADAFYNETPFARQVSDLYGTSHREILVRPNVSELLPKLLWHLDEPVSDSAFITTYLVSKFARQDVTVILSGVGGDELFGGYRRYLGEYYAQHYNRLPSWLRRMVVSPIIQALPSDRHSSIANLTRYARTFVSTSDSSAEKRYRSYVQVFGQPALDRLLAAAKRDAADSLDSAFVHAVGDDPLHRLMHVDLQTQLPNDLLMLTDKMTMAASIECRVPLLNHKLVELGAGIPAGLRIKRQALKNVLKGALKDVLPDQILHRSKRGFGAPMGAWLRQELAPLLRHVVSKETIHRRGLLNWEMVKETIALHESRTEDHTDHLIALLNFELWAQIYLDGRSPQDLSDELTRESKAA